MRPAAVVIAIVVTALIFALVVASHDPALHEPEDEDKLKPILLTDDNWGNEHQMYVTIMDQCFLPEHLQNRARVYALRFYKHPEYACENPEDALLICYPSTLHKEGNGPPGMGPAIQFGTASEESNQVTKLCTEKMEQLRDEGKELVVPWHGILVYNEGENTIVETSFDREPLLTNELVFDLMLMEYEKKSFTQIGLLQGNNDFIPFVRSHDNNTLWVEDPDPPKSQKKRNKIKDPIGREFMKNINAGARLKNYMGLWMVGLDMLPASDAVPTDEPELTLHVYRPCNCSLKAYFISPADNLEFEPHNKLSLGDGTSKCDARSIDQSVPVNLKAGKTITLKGITDKNAEPIQISIFLLGNGDEEVLNITVTDDKAYISGPKDIHLSEYNHTTLKKDTPFKLTLVTTKYGYELGINGSPEKIKYWPSEWWNVGDKGVEKMKLEGNFVLLHTPEDGGQSRIDSFIPLPFTDHFHFMVLKSVVIRAEIEADAKSFSIALLQDAPMKHEKIGATAMELHVNLITGNLHITSHKHGEKIGEDNVEKNPFQKGQAYEVRIDVLKGHFSIKANDKEIRKYPHPKQIPVTDINWLRVVGGIRLFEKPDIKVEEIGEKHTGTNFTLKLNRLLALEDAIKFVGRVDENATLFSISLMHGLPDDPKKYTVLMLEFDFRPTRIGKGDPQKYIYGYSDDETKKNIITGTLTENPFTTPDDMHLRFNVFAANAKEPNGGFSVISGQNVNNALGNYPTKLPTWVVNYISVTGDVYIIEEPSIHPSVGNNKIKPVDDLIKPGIGLKSGDVILVKGLMKADKVSISLFNEALDRNERFGYTLLSIVLDPSGKTGSEPNTIWIDAKDMFAKNVTIEIRLTETSYLVTITVDGSDKAPIVRNQTEDSNLFWAIQYIVVDGNFDIDGQIEVVKEADVQ